MPHDYLLDPAAALDLFPEAPERAMVELVLLTAVHHGASHVEYRTVDDRFFIAQFVDGEPWAFPEPPDCIRPATIEHLQTMFAMSAEQDEASRSLQIGEAIASARCEITADRQGATIWLTKADTLADVDLKSMIDRFWRRRAARQGLLGLVRYNAERLIWSIEDWAAPRSVSRV